jgi:hypothetical protein
MSRHKHLTRKPTRLPEKAAAHPISCLREVFSNFRLYELRKELKCWLYVGISNEDSAYEDVQERRNLIRFRKEIRKLAEALSVINSTHRSKREKERLAEQPLEMREKLEERNRPTYLSNEQMANPMPVVKQFCKRFTRKYVKGEMRDWLEAVITYDGKFPKPVYKGSILIFYECLLCLCECAFTLADKREPGKAHSG